VETYKQEEISDETSEELEKVSETSNKPQEPTENIIENAKESQEPLPAVTLEAAVSETIEAPQVKSLNTL
jgi:hypothetical protein